MKHKHARYEEILSDIITIRHKIAPYTEKKTFHLHTQMEMIFAKSDNLIFKSDLFECPIPPYSFLLLNTKCLHYIDSVPNSGYCDRYVITFAADVITKMNTDGINLMGCFLNPTSQCILLTPDASQLPELFTLLDSMEELTELYLKTPDKHDATMHFLELKFQLGRLLILTNRLYQKKYQISVSLKYQQHSQLVTDLCQYIDANLQNSLSIDELAQHFMVSKTLLYNITNEILHIPLSDYISTVRLNKAKALLVGTDYSVEIISQNVGYSNISSFSRFFKSNVGCSPLKYRQNLSLHAVSGAKNT